MKTSEHILSEALLLLNTTSAASVTTNGIADASDISVGNLYYHFKNKDDILLALFKQFSNQVAPLFVAPCEVFRLDDWIHWWHQWFDQVHDFQFLFHDQSYLIRRNKTLKHEYDVLVKRIERQQLAQFMELKKSGSLIATDADAERLAKQVMFIAIMWQDFFDLVTQNETDKVTALQSALTQTLGLLLPYLRVDEQLVVEQYSKY